MLPTARRPCAIQLPPPRPRARYDLLMPSSTSDPRAWFFSDAPYAGGAERYIEWHLDAAGPERLGLIAVESPGLKPWITRREEQGFRVRRIPCGSLRQQITDTWRCVHGLAPELIHVNLPHPYDGLMGSAPRIARLAGARRIVVTEHIPSFGRIGKRYWFKRASMGATDRAIAVCNAHRPVMVDVLGYSADRVVAVPNGAPDSNPHGRIAAAERGPLPADLAARETTDGPRLIQVGSLHPRKGGDLLIEAAARLRDQSLDFSIWLIGEGPSQAEFEGMIAEASLADRVHLVGHRDDVAEILSASDVAVLSSRQEGMPLSLIEAMSQGLPMVASDVDGVGELVFSGENGHLIPPEDVGALTEALADLIQDAERRVNWGTAARRRYEREHTLELMTKLTFAQYGDSFASPTPDTTAAST